MIDLKLFHRRNVQIRKVDPATDARRWRWVLQMADRFEPRVREAFLAAAAAVKDDHQAWLAFEAAFRRGDLAAAMAALDLERRMNALLRGSFVSSLVRLIHEAGAASTTAAAASLGGQARVGRAVAGFDVVNPNVMRFLERYQGSLITRVTNETRQSVLDVVREAVRDGGHPYAQARRVRELVGLLPRQAEAVRRYRDTLSLEARPQAQVERMVERFVKRQLTSRAETISRTETLRAVNAGQVLSWLQMQEQGLLRGDQRKRWIVTPDDRLCPDCAAVPSMNKEGRLLTELFVTPLGPVEAPPLHPNCRCTMVLLNP